MADCGGCDGRRGAHAGWTCSHCGRPRAEAVAEEVWRALFARRLVRAGLAPERAGLDFWELTLLSLIEEDEHGRDRD